MKGIREGMANILNWLNEESKRQSEPILLPLYIEKLIELRHQNELLRREISSRQKILTELQTDAQKIAAANPDSITSRQILDDCSDAQEKFAALLSISKAYADNIEELFAALSDFNNIQSSISEKLLCLDEKLSTTSLTNLTAMDEISDELKQLMEDDWKQMENKCKWILAVPNVSHTRSAIKKFISRVENLTSYGRNIEELCKTYNELQSKLAINLTDLETKAQTLEKHSLNPIDLAKQRSFCQQLQAEYQNCRSDFEKLNDTVSKLVEAKTIARMKMKGSVEQSEQVQAVMHEVSCMQQRCISLVSFLRSKEERISTDSEKLSEWDLQRDGLHRWISNENKRLTTDCPVTLVNEIIQTNIAKVERLEEILIKEKQLEMEEIRSKARLLMSDPSVPGTSDIACSQKALEIDWEKLNQAISTLKKWNECAKQLLEGRNFSHKI
uniref:Uncharacterized protein n=1 Tax=Setaria digitata TaxID=48799 RepID=A0A915Q3V6_9BILA